MNNFFNFRSDIKLNISIKEPDIEMSIIKRLGRPKFWVSTNDFNVVMEKIYRTVSKKAREMYYKGLEVRNQ